MELVAFAHKLPEFLEHSRHRSQEQAFQQEEIVCLFVKPSTTAKDANLEFLSRSVGVELLASKTVKALSHVKQDTTTVLTVGPLGVTNSIPSIGLYQCFLHSMGIWQYSSVPERMPYWLFLSTRMFGSDGVKAVPLVPVAVVALLITGVGLLTVKASSNNNFSGSASNVVDTEFNRHFGKTELA